MKFHLNKAKEIRRLQYVNQLYKKQKLRQKENLDASSSPNSKAVRYISRTPTKSRNQSRSKSPYHNKDWTKYSKVVQDSEATYIVVNPSRKHDLG